MKSSIPFLFLFFLLITTIVRPQDEAYICQYLFASSNEITQLSTDAISLAVDAVWGASGITGSTTTTGTLTQSSLNPDNWTYSSIPTDRLVLIYNDGSSVTFIFYSIDGYTDGDEEDFKWSHEMDFNAFIKDFVDIRIYSYTYPQNGIIYWQRTIKGTYIFNSQTMNLNINHNGNIDYDIGNGYAFYTYSEQATGTSSTGTFQVNINEQYIKQIANNSNTSSFVENTEIINNSSGNFNGTSYQYQNADVFWAAGSVIYGGYYDKVVDPDNWSVQGVLLKNQQSYGQLKFDGPVMEGTYGPDLILHLNSGTDILLHKLIAFPVTSVKTKNEIVSDFKLYQNYPNPFNPSTIISYYLPVSSNVTLKIINSIGQEVKTLINEYQTAGFHSKNIDFNSALPSGVYFYKLEAVKFSSVKKMLLLK